MNQRGFISILVTIIVTALLVGGGVYYYQETKKQAEVDKKVQEVSAKATDEINKLQDRVDELEKNTQNQPDVWTIELFDDMSGWQTYSDEKYGFSIKYPNIYTMENSDRAIVLTRKYPATENNMLGGRQEVQVRVLDGNDDLESYNKLYNWVKGGFVGDDAYYNRQDVNINNNNFVSFDVASGMDTVKEYFLVKDGLVYMIYDSMLGVYDHSMNDNIVYSFNFLVDTSDWQTYSDSSFTVSYPDDWQGGKVRETDPYIVGFAPKTMHEDFQWGINVYNKDSGISVENIIADIGDQFLPDREESRKSIFFNGIDALEIIVTTSKYPDWYSKNIIFEKDNQIYSISNGAIKDEKFDTFYSSFKLK
ncbi:hypothetical protein KKH39_05160 [Patescibacteria group bacterium]|nr:hypothetical protein [Patescibacteria group bacterium]